MWYYSAISVKNETFDDEEYEYDLNLLQSAAFPCFKNADKANYAAALRFVLQIKPNLKVKFGASKLEVRKGVIEISPKIDCETNLRDDLINRGTYENLNAEFLTPANIKWAETTKPSFDMDELPRPKLHHGESNSFHLMPLLI